MRVILLTFLVTSFLFNGIASASPSNALCPAIAAGCLVDSIVKHHLSDAVTCFNMVCNGPYRS